MGRKHNCCKKTAVTRICISAFTVCAVFICLDLCVFAEKTSETVAKLIIEQHYPKLTKDSEDKIRGILDAETGESDKITAMCDLLDKYTEYYTYGKAAQKAAAPPLEYSLDGALYIKINRMDFGVGREFNSLISENPDRLIVLDLSECGGGLIEEMEEIAQTVIPEGLLYSIVTVEGKQDRYITNNGLYKKRKIITVVTKKTASSAEILAAALKDTETGYLIGRRTYGKASVQLTKELRDGNMFRLTVGKWLTGKGEDIEGTGVEPHLSLGRAVGNRKGNGG